MKLTAWRCDVIGSIFLVVPPAGSGWRLTKKNKGVNICRFVGILELKLNQRWRVSVDNKALGAPPSRVLISQRRPSASGLIP
jgi:hypothetical protein